MGKTGSVIWAATKIYFLINIAVVVIVVCSVFLTLMVTSNRNTIWTQVIPTVMGFMAYILLIGGALATLYEEGYKDGRLARA
jgi:magnesium-transporting ATPase (P-type)